MQYVDLIGAHPKCLELRQFSNALFDALRVTTREERESSNYVDGYYLKGILPRMTLKVARSDFYGPEHDDLPWRISVAADLPDLGSLEAAVNGLVRSRAQPAGFKLARMIVIRGVLGERRIDYRMPRAMGLGIAFAHMST